MSFRSARPQMGVPTAMLEAHRKAELGTALRARSQIIRRPPPQRITATRESLCTIEAPGARSAPPPEGGIAARGTGQGARGGRALREELDESRAMGIRSARRPVGG